MPRYKKRFSKKYTIKEIFDLIDYAVENRIKHINFDGHRVNFTSATLLCFRYKGVGCINCDRVGEYFVKEIKHDDTCCLMLYSSKRYPSNNPNNRLVEMTKDHIIPRSKNGNETLRNFRTMCLVCNGKRGNTKI